jgi:small GTP-binding protein
VDFEVEKINILSTSFSLQLWDTAGNERFRSIARAYYRGAHAVILAFDVGQVTTLDSIKLWLNEASQFCNSEFDAFIVGCKMDIMTHTSIKEIKALAKAMSESNNAEFWLSSAATGENVDKLFERVSCVVYERLANINTVKLEEKSQVSMGNNLGSVELDNSEKSSRRGSKCC